MNSNKSDLNKDLTHGSSHWKHQRITALALIPLILWFVFTIALIGKSNYKHSIDLVSNYINASLFLLLIIFAFWHANLGIQVVIEDYISSKNSQRLLKFVIKFIFISLSIIAILSVLKIAFS